MNDNQKIELVLNLINNLKLTAEADYSDGLLIIRIENLNLDEDIDLSEGYMFTY